MANPDPIKSGFDEKDVERLRSLVPLHTLPEDAFAELLEDVHIDSFGRGDVLFNEGDTDQTSFYLIEGRMSLLSGKRVVDTINASDENTRFPLVHVLPRKNTVRAITRGRVARVDSRRVSELLARTDRVDYQVDDLEDADSGDWMSLLLQSPVLQQLPAANIQRVMMSVEQVDMEKGEQIIRQGEPGDYFYMLVRGRVSVTRQELDGKTAKELAQLGPGSAFGQEALLSDSPRNSTITLLEDGQVLRLAKKDFLELIQSPLSRHIDFDEAVARVEKGAVWVDLRSPDDYEKDHFPGSVNVPVESLRFQVSSLAPDRHYVLYSNSGGRAAVAAFLMTDQGYDVSLLEGGLNRLRQEQPEVSLPEVPMPPAGGGVGEEADEEAGKAASEPERRLQAAEQRAQALEQQLEAAEAAVQDAEQRNRQDLDELRATLDQAREKLLVSEQEKEKAQAERHKALAEMEALAASLETLESERGQLAERIQEIEGLDKKRQTRLEKIERELLGERERAESANESLEEINRRLKDVLQEREQERERHARETGELKEEMTALQLELEQALSELEELRTQQASAEADSSLHESLDEKTAQLIEAERLLQSMRAEARDSSEALTGKEARLAEAEDELERLRREKEELVDRVSQLEKDLAEREKAHGTVTERLGVLEQEQERLQIQAAELEALSGTAECWRRRSRSWPVCGSRSSGRSSGRNRQRQRGSGYPNSSSRCPRRSSSNSCMNNRNRACRHCSSRIRSCRMP